VGAPDGLADALDALLAGTAPADRLAADPLHLLARYTAHEDIALAAVFVSALSFGRVAAFLPVASAVLDVADADGGPAAYLRGWTPDRGDGLLPLQHRWVRGLDLALLAGALARAEAAQPLGARFVAAWRPDEADLGPALDRVILTLRGAAVDEARARAERAGEAAPAGWSALPRGLRSLLCRPAEGSACKRWCMFLRWMVRLPDPQGGGVDLGLWPLPASALVIPLDTHVHRLAGYLGLTTRGDGSFRTAQEITAALRRLRPDDPLRWDFALAHHGISGACTGEVSPRRCDPCALRLQCANRRAAAGDGLAGPPDRTERG
jgi:uncharacterized protein (TIGR02757 family)